MHLCSFLLALAVPFLGTGYQQAKTTPDVVDLREYQSPHRSQGGRTACTYYPPIAALEAAYRRKGTNVSLSVEHLIWLRNVTAMKSSVKDATINENNLAFLTGGGLSVNFDILNHYGVSRAEHFPYLFDHEDYRAPYYKGFDVTDYKWYEPHRQLSLNRFNLDPRQYPKAARQDAHYGIKEYVFLSGKECKDISKIEEILASGHEVAVNLFVSYSKSAHEKDRGNIPSVIWYVSADAAPRQADSHAMLIVGYDRKRQFFIVKNSWGPTSTGFEEAKLPEGWKDIARYKGYTLMHYNYLKCNREAAYIKEVADPQDRRFELQRALGLWRFAIEDKQSRKAVVEGVLAWRKLMNDSKESFRIGDWYSHEGKQYRVNAELDSSDASQITLFIDFDQPQVKRNQRRGMRFVGKLNLPGHEPGELLGQSIQVSENNQQLFGYQVTGLTFKASQSLDANLLATIKNTEVKSDKKEADKK